MLKRDRALKGNIYWIPRRHDAIEPMLDVVRCDDKARLVPLACGIRRQPGHRQDAVERAAFLAVIDTGAGVTRIIGQLVFPSRRETGWTGADDIAAVKTVLHAGVAALSRHPLPLEFE